jgi:methionyl aminopeptidase
VIVRKTPYEIALMRRAGDHLARVTEQLQAACQVGTTTDELDQLGDRLIRDRGGRPGFLGYGGYKKSICVSINEVAVHGVPSRRKIKDGDLVSLDLGLVLEGFWADMGCTVLVGDVDPEAARLKRVTDECLDLAIAAAQPGGRLGDIGFAVQRHAEAAGFSVIRQFVGHGIGREMHEDPQVPNFGVPGTGPELKPGMTLAIEPMINQGGPDVVLADDGWTVSTADGKLSSYREHTVAITKEGPVILTVPDNARD